MEDLRDLRDPDTPAPIREVAFVFASFFFLLPRLFLHSPVSLSFVAASCLYHLCLHPFYHLPLSIIFLTPSPSGISRKSQILWRRRGDWHGRTTRWPALPFCPQYMSQWLEGTIAPSSVSCSCSSSSILCAGMDGILVFPSTGENVSTGT